MSQSIFIEARFFQPQHLDTFDAPYERSIPQNYGPY
jgi:hypothetical protein